MCCREALLVATPEDIINIADILGVTFQDNCVATALKAWTINYKRQQTLNVVFTGV